jgi:hypothetical protein
MHSKIPITARNALRRFIAPRLASLPAMGTHDKLELPA